MGKIVFLVIIAVVIWVLFKGLGKKDSKSSERNAQKPADDSNVAERMVKCHRCGVLMPESESMMLDGNMSCHDPAHCLHRA